MSFAEVETLFWMIRAVLIGRHILVMNAKTQFEETPKVGIHRRGKHNTLYFKLTFHNADVNCLEGEAQAACSRAMIRRSN